MSAVGSEQPSPPPPHRVVRMRLVPDMPGRPCEIGPDVVLELGRWYVVSTGDGERVGTLAVTELVPACRGGQRIAGTVTRPASDDDLAHERQLAELRHAALGFCRRRANELKLPIRPVAATTALDRPNLVVTYAAEERVDVRELARDMSHWAQRRVELRPVGVRDQAKASGGLGHCGRMLCCTTFMTHFSSVTVRMAKAQNLALNPARISGMCGRLMCCLGHEMPAGQRPARPARQG